MQWCMTEWRGGATCWRKVQERWKAEGRQERVLVRFITRTKKEKGKNKKVTEQLTSLIHRRQILKPAEAKLEVTVHKGPTFFTERMARLRTSHHHLHIQISLTRTSRTTTLMDREMRR